MSGCGGCWRFLQPRAPAKKQNDRTQELERGCAQRDEPVEIVFGQRLAEMPSADLADVFKRQISDDARQNAFLFEVNWADTMSESFADGSPESQELPDMRPPKYDDFSFQSLFESYTPVDVPWTRLPELEQGVSITSLMGPAGGKRNVVMVEPWVLRKLAEHALTDMEHFLRPGHLAQLSRILQDPEASVNDKSSAHSLLRNAVTAAKGVPSACQDKGTVTCLGKKGQFLWTGEEDERHLSYGIYDAFTKQNLKYSQLAPVSMFDERSTRCNPPAQFDLRAVRGNEYRLMFSAKGNASASKTCLYQQTEALLNPRSLEAFLAEKIAMLGTSACPPCHLAIVIGGLSADCCLRAVELASARHLDDLPLSGNDRGRAYRDTTWEEKISKMCHGLGMCADFGGKYFVHDVRVIRMPRQGASCPVGIGVSCSSDRQVLAKITDHGVFIEELEKSPERFLEDVGPCASLADQAVRIDLDQPMEGILEGLTRCPIKTCLSLTGTIIVARDIAQARLTKRLERERSLPDYMGAHVVYYAASAKTPAADARSVFSPTTTGSMDTCVPYFQKHGYSMVALAKGNRAQGVTESCHKYGGFYLGTIGGGAADLVENSIKKAELVEYEELGTEAIWRIVVDSFPAFIIVDDKGNDFFADWKM